jgi:hypothetical protein
LGDVFFFTHDLIKSEEFKSHYGISNMLYPITRETERELLDNSNK